jgi:sulfite reductase (NADPH) flavoprotein alpha-component
MLFDELFLRQLADNHTPDQQIWLSGYLYGVAAGQKKAAGSPAAEPSVALQAGAFAIAPAPANAAPAEKVTVLYGSQTGNSKKVAQQAATALRGRGLDVHVADLNDYPVKNLKSEKIALVVVSTQGEGDPPVAAEEFYQWLHSARAPRLEGVRFSVCALGDKSYTQYCKTGKDIDARLAELGAVRLADRQDCDAEYEEEAAHWIAALSMALENVAAPQAAHAAGNAYAANGASVRPAADTLTLVQTPTAPQYTRKNPFSAPILEKIQLNGRGSVKETWHLELGLDEAQLAYQPGDALGIFPQNPEPLVREVLYNAMLNGNKVLSFNGREGYFRDFLLRDVELTTLTRETVENYANWSNSAKLKSILADADTLKKFLWGRGVADLLREFPTALSEATLLGILRKMQPRLYSIASSLSAHPDEVHLTVAAVRYQYDGRQRTGAGSVFLADRVEIGDSVPVFVEHNEYFKLPANDDTDIIMVGPGTGVAPFRAFVEERAERGASGKNWLFFGNPHFETDFLYQSEWLKALKNGTLDRLDVAFSRDQTQKVYVQHRLTERAALIFDRLENGAYFYVCGDKNHMAADVQRALLQVIEKQSGQSPEYAAEYLKNLKKQRRFLEDVY